MFLLAVFLVLGISSSSATNNMAASAAQIKFAIENKYDDTGPGSKKAEFAYKTYKNLDDALIAYLDDPDTKLPDHERAIALDKLKQLNSNKPHSYIIKDIFEDKKQTPVYAPKTHFYPDKVYFAELPKTKAEFPTGKYTQFEDIFNGNRHQINYKKPQVFKTKQLHLSHLKKDPKDNKYFGEFNPHPSYTFSYGVHDGQTGDSKSAHETRQDGRVTGYYTVMDADGKQRTVHYTADDKEGFKAVVSRTEPNKNNGYGLI